MTTTDTPFEVFLIDDEENGRFVTAHYLRKSFPRVRVREFSSAEAALVALQAHVPDAIITDYVLPQMRGVEFTKNIRARAPLVPIIMLSGLDPIADEALAAGVNVFLPTSAVTQLGKTLHDLLQSAGAKATQPLRSRDAKAG